MRLIDAHKLEKEFKQIYNCDPTNYQSLDWGTIKNTIRDQHEVDTVKHGHWIKHEQTKTEVSYEECSLCHCVYNQGGWMAYGYYCPHCGAKMDEEVTTK